MPDRALLLISWVTVGKLLLQGSVFSPAEWEEQWHFSQGYYDLGCNLRERSLGVGSQSAGSGARLIGFISQAHIILVERL